MATPGPTPGVLVQIESLLPTMRQAEQKVADLVLTKSGDVVHMSVTEAADASGTSEATVIRLARRLGYPGFAAMKIALAMEMHGSQRVEPGSLTPSDDLRTVKEKVLRTNVGSLEDTLELLDDDSLEQAISALIEARRIEVYGVGRSAAMAQHAYATLMEIGLPIAAITDPHLQATSAVQLRRGDVALAITLTGNARDTVEALQLARDAGATTICLTRHARSPITQVADIVLLAAARLKSVETYQQLDRVGQVAVIELLCTAVLLRQEPERLDALLRGRKAVSSSKHY
jgi:RpiR family carbohydrate utilization transcriptional regulator